MEKTKEQIEQRNLRAMMGFKYSENSIKAGFDINNLSARFINNLDASTINNLDASTINNLSASTINNLSARFINNLSARFINNLSASTINNLDARFINNLSARFINNLSASTINNLSASTINNLSASTINNLSASTINNLDASTINNLDARKKEIELDLKDIPVLSDAYTVLLKEINDKKRCYSQSTFGEIEDFDPKLNVCKTAMCIAGHLVNMCGKPGYDLMKKHGWVVSAELIHSKFHPTFPCPDFGLTNQANGLACIEVLAEMEANENK